MANEIDTPSVLPDEYAAAIGRIAETWAQFEHQIDLGIWQLSDTHQQLAACITAQLASYYPKMKALIALAEIRGASADSVKKLNSFLGSLVPLADKRNRSVHDPRAINQTTSTVGRLQITAKPVHFGFVVEHISDLKKIRNQIYKKVWDFVRLRDTVIAEIEALPDESLPQLVEIVPHHE